MNILSETIKDEIQELTSCNCHIEARLLISKELELVDLHEKYDMINHWQKKLGYLSEEWNDRRNKADKLLFRKAWQYKYLF